MAMAAMGLRGWMSHTLLMASAMELGEMPMRCKNVLLSTSQSVPESFKLNPCAFKEGTMGMNSMQTDEVEVGLALSNLW